MAGVDCGMSYFCIKKISAARNGNVFNNSVNSFTWGRIPHGTRNWGCPLIALGYTILFMIEMIVVGTLFFFDVTQRVLDVALEGGIGTTGFSNEKYDVLTANTGLVSTVAAVNCNT